MFRASEVDLVCSRTREVQPGVPRRRVRGARRLRPAHGQVSSLHPHPHPHPNSHPHPRPHAHPHPHPNPSANPNPDPHPDPDPNPNPGPAHGQVCVPRAVAGRRLRGAAMPRGVRRARPVRGGGGRVRVRARVGRRAVREARLPELARSRVLGPRLVLPRQSRVRLPARLARRGVPGADGGGLTRTLTRTRTRTLTQPSP